MYARAKKAIKIKKPSILRTLNRTPSRTRPSSLTKHSNQALIETSSSMRRVSSRQRLVSWDAFDAAISESHLQIETHYEAPSAVAPLSDSESPNLDLSALKTRKRYRVERTALRHLLSSAALGLNDVICDDVQLLIASFLDVNDARVLMTVSKQQKKLISRSTLLWEQWCHQQWPQLPGCVKFCDESSTKRLNYSQLLDLAVSNAPTHVDSSTFMLRNTTMFQSINNSANTIQYQGVVGTGDRCIRANAPLERPVEEKKKRTNLFKFLLHRPHRTNKPFVSPFLSNGKVMLTPRLASYFEISILTEAPEIAHHQQGAQHTPDSPDCIAIGLSTKGFRCFSRMPGWDGCSYGYHGDDGGVFHASGDMLKRFGPSFGKGDTIGCGVNYRNGGIFYTLNGKFLGYAWTGLDLNQKELFPTVGVDSNSPVECNFGEKDYQFDFCMFLRNERDLERLGRCK